MRYVLYMWFGSLVDQDIELDSRLDSREFDSRPTRLILGWVTVFGRANHLSISPSHPGQLSLLPSVGREMSTGESAVKLCAWGVKAGMLLYVWLIPLVDKLARVADKTCDPSLTCTIPERLRNESLVIKRYTNKAYLYLYLYLYLTCTCR